MKPVTVINRLAIKPGKMDDFIEAQQKFAAKIRSTSSALVGGRMYRSVDGTSAVLVSVFASREAQQGILESERFKEHVESLKAMVESSSPSLYEEAYTTGDFR
jgi:quinol monooxygenase YgiN